MKCSLVNFGDNLRIVLDINKRPINVAPGEVKSANLDVAYVAFISRAMKTDPLCVFETDQVLDADTIECLAIMANIASADYDSVLVRTTALIGAEAVGQTRPSRGQLMALLRDVAIKAQKVRINEQVPTKDDPRRTPSEQRPPAPDRSKPPEPVKPNNPGASQTTYAPTMAKADDHTDGVLKEIIAPMMGTLDGLPCLVKGDEYSLDNGGTWYETADIARAALAKAVKQPIGQAGKAMAANVEKARQPPARSSAKEKSKPAKKRERIRI